MTISVPIENGFYIFKMMKDGETFLRKVGVNVLLMDNYKFIDPFNPFGELLEQMNNNKALSEGLRDFRSFITEQAKAGHPS